MNNEKLRIVMIGCGRFAGNFVSLFKNHPVTEKVYVCDLKKDRERDYMERYGVDGYESFEKALEDKNINAVAIFTPREKHGPMVIAALKAGKHVYSAVPCAVSVDEIIEIEKLVRETRLTYSMGETGFYRAPAIYCREEFKKGTFGKFVYAEAQYNHDGRQFQKLGRGRLETLCRRSAFLLSYALYVYDFERVARRIRKESFGGRVCGKPQNGHLR